MHMATCSWRMEGDVCTCVNLRTCSFVLYVLLVNTELQKSFLETVHVQLDLI